MIAGLAVRFNVENAYPQLSTSVGNGSAIFPTHLERITEWAGVGAS